MQKNDRWPEDYDPSVPKSRPGSRRNSASLSRRSSLKKEKKSPPSSNSSTPKKTVKQNLDFVVTGKQILKRSDRANSLPGAYHRRPSMDSTRPKRSTDSPKKTAVTYNQAKSRDTSVEDDNSLDLSQVSDFEDTNSKYGIKRKFQALATSTPRSHKPSKNRSCSLQSQIQVHRVESSRREKSLDSSKQSSLFSSMSRDSVKTCSSGYRYGTELDYSSVSPEYSGQSSTDMSPRVQKGMAESCNSQMQVSSCCVSTYHDCSDTETKVEEYRRPENGEWNNFWANYNNSLSDVPLKSYYDQCPTPYRTDNFDLADLVLPPDLMGEEQNRSPDKLRSVNQIIRQEGLHLTPRETQNMIKCAHILGNVLTRAIERQSQESKSQLPDAEVQELELKKRNLTLDLKETDLSVPEDFRKEMTTQTDISLPNTKTAPKIFESILRQLSRSSLEEKDKDNKEQATEEVEEKTEVSKD